MVVITTYLDYLPNRREIVLVKKFSIGYIGDYLDFTNRKIIPERKFKKKYKIVDTYVNK